MPDLSSTDAPFGFMPWEDVKRSSLYSVVTSCATAFFPGDLVQVADPLLTPHKGYLTQVTQCTSGAAGLVCGVVLACFDENMKPCGYIASGEAGNGTIAGYVMVCDDPHQVYVAQEDGDTGSIAVTDVLSNVDAINTASGNVNTFQSGMELDSNTSATTATLALKIIGVHPEDTPASASTVTGHHCRYLVKLNGAFFAENVKSS